MWNQSNSCEIKEIVESILYFKIQICFCFLKAIGPVQNSNCSSHAARWASILNQVFHCCINNPFSSDLFVFFCRSSAGWLTLSPFNLPIEHFGNYPNRYFIQIHCCLKNQNVLILIYLYFSAEWSTLQPFILSIYKHFENYPKMRMRRWQRRMPAHGFENLWKVQECTRFLSTRCVSDICSVAAVF